MTRKPACADTVALTHYKGQQCQSPNPTLLNETFVFDLHAVFQECNPVI